MNKEQRTPASPGRRRFLGVAVLASLLMGQEVICRLIFPLPEAIAFNRINYQLLAPGDVRSRGIVARGLVYDRLRFESQPDGFSEVHQLNLYGFRGSDFTIEPSCSRRRILLIGDSVVEGQGASETETISSVFERLLTDDGVEAEVINLGVVGASLSQLTPLARDSIALLNPKDVIQVLYANDLPAAPYASAFDAPARPFRRRRALSGPRLLELASRVRSGEPIYRRVHPVVPFFLPVPDTANPWTTVRKPPPGLDGSLYLLMKEGKLNPWLWQQSQAIPGILSHDFSGGDDSLVRHLQRIAALCAAGNANFVVAYVPFCGVTSERYVSSLVKMGMEQPIAEALHSEPIYRRQNDILTSICRDFELPLADTTQALIQAEAEGNPQFWSFDTHPRPAGYATIACQIYDVWRSLPAGP